MDAPGPSARIREPSGGRSRGRRRDRAAAVGREENGFDVQGPGLAGDGPRERAVEGKANRELIDFLSEVLDVPARAITILSGATGRMKRVAIAGLDAAAIRKRIPGVE